MRNTQVEFVYFGNGIRVNNFRKYNPSGNGIKTKFHKINAAINQCSNKFRDLKNIKIKQFDFPTVKKHCYITLYNIIL